MDPELEERFARFRRDRALARSEFLRTLTTMQETIVSALDDVTAAMAALTSEVDSAVAAISSQGLTSDEAGTIVTGLNDLAARISAALNPPPPGG